MAATYSRLEGRFWSSNRLQCWHIRCNRAGNILDFHRQSADPDQFPVSSIQGVVALLQLMIEARTRLALADATWNR